MTRFPPERDQKKKINAKRKTFSPNNNLSIYVFNDFEDYLEFCNYLNNNLDSTTYLKLKTSLYKYNSKYYLCINILNKNLNDFKFLHYAIAEFGSHVNNSDLFKRKLNEYGKVNFKANAIKNSIKIFTQKNQF